MMAWDFPICGPCLQQTGLPFIRQPEQRATCSRCNRRTVVAACVNAKPPEPLEPDWLEKKIAALLARTNGHGLTDFDSAVLRALFENHRGRANAVTRESLLSDLLLAKSDDRQLRNSVKFLIEKCGVPIASISEAPGGYFLIQTEAERQEAIGELRSRITSLAVRVKGLSRASEEPGGLFGSVEP